MNQKTSLSPKPTGTCRYCLSPIPLQASICTKCSSHQSKWRNEFRYFAGIIGLITAVFAGFSYVVSTLPEMRKSLFWKEHLLLLSLSEEEVAILNEGDGKVFVSDISILARFPNSDEKVYSERLVINQVVNPNEFLRYEFSKDSTETEVEKRHWHILSTTSDYEFKCALENSGNAQGIIEGRARFLHSVYSKNNPAFLNYQAAMGASLRTYPIEAKLRSYSQRLGVMIDQNVDLVGLLAWSDSSRCEPK